jgi:hypothetical protein
MSRLRHAWGTLVAGVLVLLARSDAAAQGCAMCRTALGSPDDPLARGFYWSVLLLMSAPYVVFGSIAGWLVYRHVMASRSAAAIGEPGLPGHPGEAPAADGVRP